VHINGLIENYSNSDAGMARGAGRSVSLQRYIGGVWHTMLVRTANSTGQFTVGFIQPTPYRYRIIAAETRTAWSASSYTTLR
jgi:hypothetical protein